MNDLRNTSLQSLYPKGPSQERVAPPAGGSLQCVTRDVTA
jgi:hypothetical protein